MTATHSDVSQVHLFTDGGCSGNPGPGGWGFILKHPLSGKTIEGSGAERETTNNRMELTAVIRGLEALKSRCHVELFTDSVYVGKGLSQWIAKWKTNGWQRKEDRRWVPIKNVDLWQRLDELADQHRIQYTRVAGHRASPAARPRRPAVVMRMSPGSSTRVRQRLRGKGTLALVGSDCPPLAGARARTDKSVACSLI